MSNSVYTNVQKFHLKKMFLKEKKSSVHQGCIYLIKSAVIL